MLQPGEQSLDLPALSVSAQCPAVLGGGLDAIGFVRGDDVNALLGHLGIKLVAVVGLVPDQSLRGIGDKPALKSTLDKGDFMWRSRCNVYGDRKTMAVCHSHDLRTFAPLGCSHAEPPFFATTKVPSIKHSDRSSFPRLRRSSAMASSTTFNVPDSTHSWNRRWQVWYEGKRPGRSAQGAPVRSIQKIPVNTARSSTRGRPRPSARSTLGNSGSIKFHCSSVSCSALLIGSCQLWKRDHPKLTEVLES
jgi:hypothetical protein